MLSDVWLQLRICCRHVPEGEVHAAPDRSRCLWKGVSVVELASALHDEEASGQKVDRVALVAMAFVGDVETSDGAQADRRDGGMAAVGVIVVAVPGDRVSAGRIE